MGQKSEGGCERERCREWCREEWRMRERKETLEREVGRLEESERDKE